MPNTRIFCLAKSCYNYQPSPGAPAFFNLPSDLSSRLKWVENAGRSDLKEKTVSSLSGKYYICADHFESFCFVDPEKRTVLKRDANVVPTIFKSNLASLGSLDSSKCFRDSQNTLAGTVLAEVESAQEILNSAVVPDDPLDSSEWTNIVAVSLGDDGSMICDSLNSQTQDLTETTVSFPVEEATQSNEMVMECLMLCRLCAALVQVSVLVPVFGVGADIELKKMIDRLMPGQILMDDGLPQRVCISCVERVKNCCHILDSFKAADTRLRQMVALCNFDESNIIQGGSLALQDDNGLPVILQTVNGSQVEGLNGLNCTVNPAFSTEETALQVVNTVQLVPSQESQYSVSQVPSPQCVTIGDTINFSIEVEDEALSFEESRQINCGVCQQVFEEEADLVSHCINYHSTKIEDESIFTPHEMNGTFQCTICDDVLTNGNCLRSHMFSHALRSHECSFCNLAFKDKNDLDVHLSQEHSDQNCLSQDFKGHSCDVCAKEFKNAGALRKHKLIHSGERTVLCSLCGKTLANLNSLRVHMRIHSEERPFSCSDCGKSFKGPSELRSHSVTHSREKIHDCPECGRKFHSKALVRQHMLSHTREKPHKCDICSASFNRLGNLNQHKKKHTDKTVVPLVTPYECGTCGKRFQSNLTLKYHVAKHTGDKYPFDCEVCAKKFTAIDPYRVHMRIHTGERPFECGICKKTFRSLATLKQHTASLHQDDFPFACPFCQRSFKRLQSLIVHKKTHTGEKPWQCSQCGRAFAQKGDMIKHTKTHRPHIEEEGLIMEVDAIDDLALDSEISKIIFG